MKKSFLLCLLVPFIFSCTSSYKSLQTPDDVYYSPAFLRSDDVRKDSNRVEYQPSNIIVYNNSTYHPDYDDYYYYRRRNDAYHPNVYTYIPSNTINKPRTTNLLSFGKHKSPGFINGKLSAQSSSNSTIYTSPRTFKSGTAIGNAVRSIVGKVNPGSYHASSAASSSAGKSSGSSGGKTSGHSSGHR